MLATLDVLRRREGFGGYVHIKLLPGAESAQVDEAARLANRISVNLEGFGFGFDELPFEADGNLSLDHDPKTAWARAHPEHFPLDVTRAARELLVRVPGIGPLASRRLVAARREVSAPYDSPVPPCAYR